MTGSASQAIKFPLSTLGEKEEERKVSITLGESEVTKRETGWSNARFVLRMFGAMTLETPDRRLTKFPTKRSALILARLALQAEQRVSRDELAALLWPDDYLDITRTRLRQELQRLKQAVGPFGECIRSDRQWIEIEPGSLSADTDQFDRAIAAYQIAESADVRVEALNRAVDLLKGPFLAGYQEPWVLAERRKYDERARRALLSLAAVQEARGEIEEALNATMNAIRHDPLNSEANAAFVRLLVAGGQAARARQAFVEFESAMVRELGIRPPASVRAALGAESPAGESPGAELRDDDSSSAEAASAELSDDVPELRRAVDAYRRPVLRPAPLLGRDALLETVLALLSRPGIRLVLVGPAGVGKSHLIREVAWRFARERHLPVQVGSTPESIDDGLYVVEASADVNELEAQASAAGRLGWRVLGESRVRPEGEGFTQVLVEPLPAPGVDSTPEQVLANPSVQILLSQAAGASEEEAAWYGRLARSLDGLPGALKFFAARLTVDTAERVTQNFEECLAEFVDQPAADRTSVRQIVEAALAGLPAEALGPLLALAHLDGAGVDIGTSIAAATGEGEDPSEIWQMLERRSLVLVRGNGANRRICVPAPIALCLRRREGAAENMSRVWHILADWAYAKSRNMSGPDQDLVFGNVSAEWANLMRALRWSIHHDHRLAALLTVGMWRTSGARENPSVEGPVLWQAAKLGAHLHDAAFGGEACLGAAVAMTIGGHLDDAEAAFCAAMEIYRAGGHARGLAWAKFNYASCLLSGRDPERGMNMLKEALAEATRPGVRIFALSRYSLELAKRGEIEEAVRVGEELFAERLKTDDPTCHAEGFVDLGRVYQMAHRPDAARPLIREGIRRLRETGIQDLLLETLLAYADSDLVADESEIREVLGEAQGIANRIGCSRRQLELARVRVKWEFRYGKPSGIIQAIESAFRLTRTLDSAFESERSLKMLADELAVLGKLEYANVLRAALGQCVDGPVHAGWSALLSSDSPQTLCVLASVMAKEALDA